MATVGVKGLTVVFSVAIPPFCLYMTGNDDCVESGTAAETASSRSTPSLPGSHSTPRVIQEPSHQQPVATPAAKPSDSGHRLSTDAVTSPATQPRVDEEPVIKLTPEHGAFLFSFW